MATSIGYSTKYIYKSFGCKVLRLVFRSCWISRQPFKFRFLIKRANIITKLWKMFSIKWKTLQRHLGTRQCLVENCMFYQNFYSLGVSEDFQTPYVKWVGYIIGDVKWLNLHGPRFSKGTCVQYPGWGTKGIWFSGTLETAVVLRYLSLDPQNWCSFAVEGRSVCFLLCDH